MFSTRHPHSRGQNISNIELPQSGSYIPCTSYRFLGFVNICAFSHLLILRNNLRWYCSSAGTEYSGLVSREDLSSPNRIWFPPESLNQVRVSRWHSALLHLPVRPVSGSKFFIVQHLWTSFPPLPRFVVVHAAVSTWIFLRAKTHTQVYLGEWPFILCSLVCSENLRAAPSLSMAVFSIMGVYGIY